MDVKRARAAVAFVLLALLASVSRAEAPDWERLTRIKLGTDAEIAYSRPFFDRREQAFELTATVAIVRPEPVAGRLYMVLTELTPEAAVVGNADGETQGGSPYYDLGDVRLAQGETVAQRFRFTEGARLRLKYEPVLYLNADDNRQPVADAGPDRSAVTRVPLSLDGTASRDPDGDLIEYRWRIAAAPDGSAAALTDPKAARPVLTPDLPGRYELELTVMDGESQSAPDRVGIAVSDFAPPNAEAGTSLEAGVGDRVMLDGSATNDPNGLDLSYAWSFVRVPGASALSDSDITAAGSSRPSFTPDVSGTYELRLRAGNGSLFDEDTVHVAARSQNVRPRADAGADAFSRTDTTVELDGSGSTDPDAAPQALAYGWRLVSRPPGSDVQPAEVAADAAVTTISPDVAGDYVLRLSVDDGADTDSETVVVRADDTPPTLTFVQPADGQTVDTRRPAIRVSFSDPASGIDTDSLRLTLNGTAIPDAALDADDGSARHIPAADIPSGDNQVTATVRDRAGNVATKRINFVVSVFRAIADCAPAEGEAPLDVRFRSRADFSEGSIERFRWDLDGDGQFDTSDAVARDYSFTFNEPGTVEPALQVTNNLGQTATDTCRVDVGSAAPTASADAVPSNGEAPLAVDFTCTGRDSDGVITRYEWDFDGDGVFDASSGDDGRVSHTYTEEGVFEAVCRVTDDNGLTAQARTTTTLIRSGPPGTPTVDASVSPGSFDAPRTVGFDGSARDDGSIVLWEWDFDGDGNVDYASTESPETSHRFEKAGVFAATLRATDDSGLTSSDTVEIVANAEVSIAVPDDTFAPREGEAAVIRTTQTATLPVRLILRDDRGKVVRTLVEETRPAGSYEDDWDGRDDLGEPLPQGVYYVVLEYGFGGNVREIDLTNTTGGERYNPSRNRLPSTFSPFADDLLEVTFTVPEDHGASEIQAFVGTYDQDSRFTTLLDREPLGVGDHTIYWNGLDEDGNLAVAPPGEEFLFGIFGYTLPDNAVFLDSAPRVSNVEVDPNFYDPATPDFIDPESPNAIVSFDLSSPASVELTATNLRTGRVLTRIRRAFEAGASHSLSWNGRTNEGDFVDAGDYRLTLRAADATGSTSLVRYALVRVFY